MTLAELVDATVPAEVRATPVTFMEAFAERLGQDAAWVAPRIKRDATSLPMALEPLGLATHSSVQGLLLAMEDVCETMDNFEAYQRYKGMTEEEIEDEMRAIKRARRAPINASCCLR